MNVNYKLSSFRLIKITNSCHTHFHSRIKEQEYFSFFVVSRSPCSQGPLSSSRWRGRERKDIGNEVCSGAVSRSCSVWQARPVSKRIHFSSLVGRLPSQSNARSARLFAATLTAYKSLIKKLPFNFSVCYNLGRGQFMIKLPKYSFSIIN